eukprot:scaffold33986_cov68-Attheya_sp.AAC.1
MPPKQPAAGGSIIFMLHTVFQYLKVKGEIPVQFRNMTAMNKFMKSDALPIIRLQKLTVEDLLTEDISDLCIMQVTWNRETKETMINLRGDARLLRLYSLHVKVYDDEDLQKDEYDDQLFSGLLFFIGGVNMGQAPHLKTHAEILPIHADQLFNLGEDGDDCLYIVLLTGKEGVVEQLFSPYNPWVHASPSRSPSPPSESSSLASLKTSNTAAATLTTSARRAQLSAEITNIPFDGEGLEDVDAFWDKSVALAMDPSLPPGWPAGGAKPDDEVAAMYNLVHRSAELNEAATKATTAAANIAEEELEKATHKKAEAAAILAEVKATPAAVVAVAEATKSASIAALAAYAATKKTKIAEDEATDKHVQEKAAAAVLADAEVTKAANIAKAAEDEAAAKLVQEKAAAAAVLADAEVIKVANIATALAKAAEDEAPAKLAQEKAAAAAVLADEEATTAANAAAKLVEVKAALAAEETTKALAANVAERLAVDEAAAKTVSSDSHDSDTKTDSDTSPEDPRAHAGKDDATAELVRKLAEEDLLRKESPVKSPTKKLTSALKYLESGYIEVDAGKRKRNPTGYLLPPAKRVLVLKTDKSKKQTSSRTSKKLVKKKPLKETPLLPNRLQAIVNGKDIAFFVEMIDKPMKIMNDY